jgi:hypothetical protein
VQIHQLSEALRRVVCLLRLDLDCDPVGGLPHLDLVQYDHRGPSDCRNVSGLLHIQWPTLHTLGAPCHLDLFYSQNHLQGIVQWQGTFF